MEASVALHASRSVIPPVDMILDSGASDVMFPDKDEYSCSDIEPVDGSFTIGNNSQIPIMLELSMAY